ncbi:MAG: hypothetical protein RLZ94_1488, partial [Actinomycetota bacterium]
PLSHLGVAQVGVPTLRELVECGLCQGRVNGLVLSPPAPDPRS